MRSAELHPGYVTDLLSAFYPLSRASPVLQSLDLEEHGLRRSEAPAVLAHPLGPDGAEASVLCRDRAEAAAGLDTRQITTADPSWSPAGTESAWAYTHLPRGVDDADPDDELVGVHGACGWFAARAALGAHRATGLLRHAATSAASELLHRSHRDVERVRG